MNTIPYADVPNQITQGNVNWFKSLIEEGPLLIRDEVFLMKSEQFEMKRLYIERRTTCYEGESSLIESGDEETLLFLIKCRPLCSSAERLLQKSNLYSAKNSYAKTWLFTHGT